MYQLAADRAKVLRSITTTELKEVIGRLENIRDELTSLSYYDEALMMFTELEATRPALKQVDRLLEDLEIMVWQQEIKEME